MSPRKDILLIKTLPTCSLCSPSSLHTAHIDQNCQNSSSELNCIKPTEHLCQGLQQVEMHTGSIFHIHREYATKYRPLTSQIHARHHYPHTSAGRHLQSRPTSPHNIRLKPLILPKACSIFTCTMPMPLIPLKCCTYLGLANC